MIHLALIGCGGMAGWHAQQLKQISDCKVVALIDPVVEHTRKLHEQHFAEASQYDSMETLLASPPQKLDGVVLVTPHSMHYPLTRLALERGLHVLVEKPMVTSAAHALELARLASRTGKQLAISFQAPYTVEYSYLAAERDAGRLGRIQLVNGWLSQSWLHFTTGKWRQDLAIAGGGQMYDSGAHLFNSILWLVNSPPVEAACFYDKCNTPVDINGVAIIRFVNGALASICIGGNCPPFRNEIQIQTDQMLITTDQYGGKLHIDGGWGRKIYPHIAEDRRPAGESPHLNFVNAILGREAIKCGARDGVRLALLMEALYESAEKQTMMAVRPMSADL